MKALKLVLLFQLFIAAAAAAAQAQSKTDFDAAGLFASACAPCHGATGAGDGPVAGALNTRMKALGELRMRHGGDFPADYVYQIIDGTTVITAHGTRAMPVWGRYFGQKHVQVDGEADTAASEAAARLIVNALVAHIETLQAP